MVHRFGEQVGLVWFFCGGELLVAVYFTTTGGIEKFGGVRLLLHVGREEGVIIFPNRISGDR